MKKLLISLGMGVAVIAALLGIVLVLVEAKFRPRAPVEIAVPAHQGYLQGRVSEPKGWIPFLLPGIAQRRGFTEPRRENHRHR